MSRTHRSRHTGPQSRRHPGLPFAFSDHAIEQLRQRHMPSFTIARTRVEARILSASARRTDAKTASGDDVWIATDGAAIQFVVKDDGRGGRICVTVLPGVAEREEERGVA